jgi:dihydroorotate dehydrogenase
MNAAGMFKNGEGYETAAMQGAGAYLAGTTTFNARPGNKKNGVKWPFVPYPGSHSASNWMGLPNEGDYVVSRRMRDLKRVEGCPIGVSVTASPDLQGEEKLYALVKGMGMYQEAGIDFIEMNESCPNTGHGRLQDDALSQRLLYVKNKFLDSRSKRPPVIVKFSNDTPSEQVPELVNLLIAYGFDGVNFGNTSINYAKRREKIARRERRMFDYFTSTFGGGVSGEPLKEDSLALCEAAVKQIKILEPAHEFNVVRTGGITDAADIQASVRAGVLLNQWFTGYFENFAEYGHTLYGQLYSQLLLDKEYSCAVFKGGALK